MQNAKWRQFVKNSSGVSLIIAIIFVSAFMLVMAGLFEARLRVIQAVGNREQEAKARYLAESAAELASYAAATHGAGWNLAEGADADLEGALWAAAQNLGISSCGAAVSGAATAMTPCSRMQVIGRPEAETVRIDGAGPSYFSIPMAGTGNAGEHCILASAPNDADEACNWNRLFVGQTVEIPLYYMDNSGVTQKLDVNPAGDFLLRIRAPAATGSGAAEELFPLLTNASAYRHIEKDPVLVQWTISGTSTGPGGQVVGRTLVARDRKEGLNSPYRFQASNENTEISGGRINEARIAGSDLNDFIVLRKNHQGWDITSRGGRDPRTITAFLDVVENSVLRLSLVGQPRRNTSGGATFNPDDSIHINNSDFDIPYLEYQLLTDSNNPVSDSKQIVIGWAEFGGFRKEVRREIQREATLGGFVLEQF